jgi:uncharacterized membrane protein YbhN (UPF0104 family)
MVVLAIGNQALMSWRFKVIMKQCAGVQLSHWKWFCLTSVAQFLNLFVPQLGHVHRAVMLRRECDLSYSGYTSGLAVFFWFEFLTSSFLALIIVGWRDPFFSAGPVRVLPVLAAIFLVALISPFTLGIAIKRMPVGAGRLRARLERFNAVRSNTLAMSRSPAFVAQFLVLNLLVAVGHVAMLALAFGAVGRPIGIGDLMFFQVLLKLSNLVTVTPGNLGITELAYGVLAQTIAGDLQHGIAAAVLIRTLGTFVMVTLGWALGGLPALFGRRAVLTRTMDPADRG